MNNQQFVVDAALLRELGERLIGRPAIALGELVKNSFDADATTCRIEFGKDQIVISDDGVGMSQDDFLRYWMRIGTTHKVTQGTSRIHKRPLTGSKGIGRLSVQFLADELIWESTVDGSNESLYALVDWRSIVSGNNLNTVSVDWDLRSETVIYPNGSACGTRITLKSLKNEWDKDAIRDLGSDIWMLRSPFRRPTKAATDGRLPDFNIEIEAPLIPGAGGAFDETFGSVFSNWKARIRGSLDQGCSGGTAAVSVEFRAEYPRGSEHARKFSETIQMPIRSPEGAKTPLVDSATFEILIFKPEGRQQGGISVGDLRNYLAQFGNVSVYDAGFRLPYYGSGRDAGGQDWLSIAVDQGRRITVSELLPEHLRTQNRYMLDLPAPGRIFGGVEINTNHEAQVAERMGRPVGTWLQIQPGRDRLHDNPAFDQLRDLVRFSLDFYANRFRVRALDAAEKERVKEIPSTKYDRAIDILERNKNEMPAPVFREVRREIHDARKAILSSEEISEQRAALLAPLASAGMAALALNHEIGREGTFLSRIGRRLRVIATKHSLKELKEIADEFEDARRRLDLLRELFAPLLSDLDKSATVRLRVRAVVDQTVEAMKVIMPRVKFDKSAIPLDLRFPIGSLAEWNALLQNVLSNAWNAMLDSKKAEIVFRGGGDGRGNEWLRVSDTGQGLSVNLAEAPKLFEPFEHRMKISEDKRSIAIGGQGLGLAIVRMIARRRQATVAFVQPEEGFSTTFEIAWRGSKK